MAAIEELNELRTEAQNRATLENEVAKCLRQGHASIGDALQQQENQLSMLAEVVPQIDYIHASLITALSGEASTMATSTMGTYQTTSGNGTDLRESEATRGSFYGGASTGNFGQQEEYA